MFNRIVKFLGIDPSARQIKQLAEIADEINALEPEFEALPDGALRAKTAEFKSRLQDGETLDELLPEAFAAVREASKRTIGQRHYDIQLIGGIVLHQGTIAEMRTGEGKTLVSTLPIYLNVLTGRGVHLVTVNDYLARRDARWMAPIYNFLGLSVGVLQMAARTEHGKKAFLVDLEKTSPHEDQHQLVMVPRKEAYAADVTYGTTSEFGFDYLRDNMAPRLEDRVQRGIDQGAHTYAILDEVDNVLIDEARTPLIISGPSHDDAEHYVIMASVVKQLNGEDYEVDERAKSIALTEIGEIHVEQILGEPLRDPERPEELTPEQTQRMGFLEQALRAQYVYKRNKDYLVQGGKVIIVDENTGRLMPGRRWSDGLHQAIEAKEGVRVEPENVTYATITIQNYYRKYEKLAGMTGTAETEAEEFAKIYKLEVLAIPTNLDYQASHPTYPLITKQAEDEEGYKYTCYLHKDDDPHTKPRLFKRKDYPDVIFRTEEAKFRAIGQEILRYHAMGRPILLGTTSVELSEVISGRMKAEPMRRLAQMLLLRDAWFAKNNREEDGREIAELQFLNRPLHLLPPAEMRKLARDLGNSLNPQDSASLARLGEILGIAPQNLPRLDEILKSGVNHQVLNARKHTEESQIIAGAGAFGAVTIATNMAGRGVDIKLGGEIAEEVLALVNRVLKKTGHEDPYDLTMEEREAALRALDPADYGIYEAEIRDFLQHMEESVLVKELGGLHVLGTERHESRRIDNQLRGRAGRQGDPGSSRFYLSMQDQLMRLFGGQQAENLMGRLKIDEAMPIEMGMVSKIVEQSQTRVEGANFDTRKHLLEYDDVLNNQREIIYSQRDRTFTKDDLTDDVTEMLEIEIARRVPEALADEEGPWKLSAWLEEMQPPLSLGSQLYPSFTLRLLLNELKAQNLGSRGPEKEKTALLDALLEIAERSLQAEHGHLVRSVAALLDTTEDRAEAQFKERLDTLDIFFEGLSLEEEGDEETPRRNPREIESELTALLRVPLKLTPAHLRDDLEEAREEAEAQLEDFLFTQALKRVLAAVERRLEESIDLEASAIPTGDWDAFGGKLHEKIDHSFARRKARLLGEHKDGQIPKDLQAALDSVQGPVNEGHLLTLLLRLPQGARATFDRKTRQRVWKRTTRLTYTYYAAQFIDGEDANTLREDILTHLDQARQALSRGWGHNEWGRLANQPLNSLNPNLREALRRTLGEETYLAHAASPLQKLPPEAIETAILTLGTLSTTELYRQLLLSVISSLWVDYLTQMEALRVSVGLEAYAQRDPLVEYKKQASDMFGALLDNIRLSVVSRMFVYQPRELRVAQGGEAPGEAKAEAEDGVPEAAQAKTEEAQEEGGKKRRRRRRKG